MTRYAWIDIETTGLDPVTDELLEFACIITDENFQELDRFQRLVEPEHLHLYLKGDRVDRYVFDMHTHNGLWEDLKNAYDGYSVDDLDEELEELFSKHNGGNRTGLILCGNSIGSLDLPFLRLECSTAMTKVHYRTIDVTAVRLGLELLCELEIPVWKKGSHRAMDDVEECIREFRSLGEHVYGVT